MPVLTKKRPTEASRKKTVTKPKSRITKKSREEQPAVSWREAFAHLSDEDIAGAILRDFRETAKLTQTELSRLTGIPQPHISAIEHGKLAIGKERAKKLAAVFNSDYRMFL